MAYKMPAARECFEFTLIDGLPAAPVAQWGAGFWITCCPLCGMVHEVTGLASNGAAYRPGCTLKVTHANVYADWLSLHPEAGKHCTVRLQFRPMLHGHDVASPCVATSDSLLSELSGGVKAPSPPEAVYAIDQWQGTA